MLSQLARLLFAMAAAWMVLVGPAYLVGGIAAVLGLSAAVLICLLPGMIVLVLQAGFLANQPPLSNLLVAMGLRMVFVLAAFLVARQAWPRLPIAHFAAWLVPAYLVALAVETRVALAQAVGHGRVSVDAARMQVTPPLN